MWLDPKEMSEWAYYYCRTIKDKPEIRKMITTPQWAYWYCMNIKDRPGVRKLITESRWAESYCLNIKNRSEVRKYIQGDVDKYFESLGSYYYCKNVEDTPELILIYIRDRPKAIKYIQKNLLRRYK